MSLNDYTLISDRYYDRSRSGGYERYDPYDRYYSRYDFRNYRPWDETYRYRRTLLCIYIVYIHVVSYLCIVGFLSLSSFRFYSLLSYKQLNNTQNNHTCTTTT